MSNDYPILSLQLATEFEAFADTSVQLYPEHLRAEIDAVSDRVFHDVNNGVDKAGFATTQAAYEEAVDALFTALDWLEERLADRRHLVDHPNLWAYARDLYQRPGFGDTTDFDQIKRHYYGTHERLNPSRIVPKGPVVDWRAPHGRDRLGP